MQFFDSAKPTSHLNHLNESRNLSIYGASITDESHKGFVLLQWGCGNDLHGFDVSLTQQQSHEEHDCELKMDPSLGPVLQIISLASLTSFIITRHGSGTGRYKLGPLIINWLE